MVTYLHSNKARMLAAKTLEFQMKQKNVESSYLRGQWPPQKRREDSAHVRQIRY